MAAVAQCIGWMALSRGAWTDRTEETARLPVRRPVVWMIALQSVVYLFGTALLLVGACLPLSAKRLRPV